MRLIDADTLHEALKAKQRWIVRCGDKYNEGYTYDQVHFAIDAAPTIEPKKGKWLKIVDCDTVQCSECFEDFDYIDGLCYLCHGQELPDYCPGCGAKMKRSEE